MTDPLNNVIFQDATKAREWLEGLLWAGGRSCGYYRYLAEFDFRYNHRTALGVNDCERATNMLKGISGKRLTYRRINEGPSA